MRKALFFIQLLILCSCSKNSDIENGLRQYVEDQAKTENASFDIKYKLIEYTIDDTITHREFLDSLEDYIGRVALVKNLDKEDFINTCKITYDGELDSYTEESLPKYEHWKDSLLENWQDVTRYSSELNYLYLWYTWRNKELTGHRQWMSMNPFDNPNYDEIDLGEEEDAAIDFFLDNVSCYVIADSVAKLCPDSVYRYCITHKYSAVNIITNKPNTLTDKVRMDHTFKVVESENQNSLEDILMQNITK